MTENKLEEELSCCSWINDFRVVKRNDDDHRVDFERLRETYRPHPWRGPLTKCAQRHPDIELPGDSKPYEDFVHTCHFRGKVEFPEPAGRNVNMMPFIMGDESSLPVELRDYWPMIQNCRLTEHEAGRVGYLTVHESRVPAGQTQRRPGLHTDRHLNAWAVQREGEGFFPRYERPLVWNWGGRVGGIYIASNVANSTRFWNAYIKKPGIFGDCEHLRQALGPGALAPANVLVWMTDGTPHEALPVDHDTDRQFFRLVTSNVDVWYAAHSTPNPLGITPPPSCIISYESKFTSYTLLSMLLSSLDHETTV